jgi:hypothetical protein
MKRVIIVKYLTQLYQSFFDGLKIIIITDKVKEGDNMLVDYGQLPRSRLKTLPFGRTSFEPAFFVVLFF